MTGLSIPIQQPKVVRGMSVLEARRCCVKVSKGVYKYTIGGEQLIEKIENTIHSLDQHLIFKRKSIKRAAKRPGPRQLLVFSIFQCTLKSTKKNWIKAINFVDAFSSLLSSDFNVPNRFYNKHTIYDKNIYIDYLFKSSEDLNHTIANLICIEDSIEINIGVEVLCTAIANRNTVWPAKLRPFHFEVFVSKRAEKIIVDKLLTILETFGFTYELIFTIKSEKSFCSQKIIISDGKLPYLIAINVMETRKNKNDIRACLKKLLPDNQ